MGFKKACENALQFEKDYQRMYHLVCAYNDWDNHHNITHRNLHGSPEWKWFTFTFKNKITGCKDSILLPDCELDQIRFPGDQTWKAPQICIDGANTWWYDKDGILELIKDTIEQEISEEESNIKDLAEFLKSLTKEDD